jgi:NTP pyrophosphatase (non-canonical NTP hydrolase)
MLKNTDPDQQLLIITAEECAELAQVCMKWLRFTEPQMNLAEEVGDVQCMINLLVERGLVTTEQIAQREQAKRAKLKIYSNLMDA